MNEGIFTSLWTTPNFLAAIAAINFVGWFKLWNERKRDTVTEKGGDWTRLRSEIDRLDKRCDHLQTEVDECRKREGEWMQRAIAAEAAQIGMGHARQEAANIIAVERLEKP